MGLFDFFKKKEQESPMSPEQKKGLSEMQKVAAMGVLIAQKRPIVYSRVDFSKLDPNAQREILNSMKKGVTKGGLYKDSIVKKNSIVFGVPAGPESYINTFFAGMFSKDFEEKDVKFDEGNVIVKGPLSEVYKIKDEERLKTLYKNDNGSWMPIHVPKRLVRLTGKLFSHMSSSKLFKILGEDKLELITSYGGTHVAAVGDYLMIEGSDFYRIKKKAFDKTYEIISEGLKKMIPTAEKAIVGGCKRCVYRNNRGERFVRRGGWVRV